MSRLLSSTRLSALGLLLALCASTALLPTPTARPSVLPPVTACLLVSSNTREDLDLSAASARLRSVEHLRYRRLAGDILQELGVRGHRVQDALGEWQGNVENSLFVSLHRKSDALTLTCAAAWFGLAARQKAVLAFHADEQGEEVLAFVELPNGSLKELRELLDRHRFCDRTLIRRGTGWRAVILTDDSRREELEELPATVRVQRGRAVVLGESTRDGAQKRYREVIHSYHKTSAIPPLAILKW